MLLFPPLLLLLLAALLVAAAAAAVSGGAAAVSGLVCIASITALVFPVSVLPSLNYVRLVRVRPHMHDLRKMSTIPRRCHCRATRDTGTIILPSIASPTVRSTYCSALPSIAFPTLTSICCYSFVCRFCSCLLLPICFHPYSHQPIQSTACELHAQLMSVGDQNPQEQLVCSYMTGVEANSMIPYKGP